MRFDELTEQVDGGLRFRSAAPGQSRPPCLGTGVVNASVNGSSNGRTGDPRGTRGLQRSDQRCRYEGETMTFFTFAI